MAKRNSKKTSRRNQTPDAAEETVEIEAAPDVADADDAAEVPSLSGRRVAIVCTDGVEQIELTSPRAALEAAGAEVVLIAPHGGTIKGWNFADWGEEFEVDQTVQASLAGAYAGEFDALMLPGGPLNGDALRQDPTAAMLVSAFFAQNKPVAAICHAHWILAEADVLRGRTVTSFPGIATDCRNAGATWVNEATVIDGNLLTSRHPGDLPHFNVAMAEHFARA